MIGFLARRLWLLVIVAFLIQIAAWVVIIRISRNQPGTRPVPVQAAP